MRILDKTVNKRDQKDGDRLGFNWIFTGRNISTIPVMAVQLRINKTKNVGKTGWWCGQKLSSPLPPIALWTGNARNQYSYFFLHILCCITADLDGGV